MATKIATQPFDLNNDVALSDIRAKLKLAEKEIKTIVYGQDEVISLSLAGLLAGGHIMLIGVPGLAKTLLIETLGKVLGLDAKRVQCTPDLMPSDITGTEILDQTSTKSNPFTFIEGPVFTNLLMADEINRASPRTQSALLQAMQEKEVSVAGKSKALPRPFHVLATRNPLEQEGTYPLPEAQLDRFLLQIYIDYPDAETEAQILLNTTGDKTPKVNAVLSHQDFETLQSIIRQMPVGEDFIKRCVRLVREARPETSSLQHVKDHVLWAPGPRAGQALIGAAKAHAFMKGRLTPDSSDLEHVAYHALNHRMALSYTARSEGITLPSLINDIVEASL